MSLDLQRQAVERRRRSLCRFFKVRYHLPTWTSAGRTVSLEVSAGLGTAPSAPVRFACRPEAVVLELLPRA